MESPEDRRAQRWAEADRIFSAALDLHGEERDRFIRDQCAADTALRDEVRALLAAADDDGFLAAPPDPREIAAAFTNASPAGDAPIPQYVEGARIGPYRIVRTLGRGGMGDVYLAERVEGFDQRVALKTLRRGLDTADVIRRFLAERQILAHLDHPHIARLLDGGSTEDGRPWLAMEFVQGQPITDHANEESLDVRARVALLRTVAEALEHAHRHLVVHRDLKPSNVFVTHDGRVKLLDFGIARLVGDESGGPTHTSTGHRFLTPAYAAPEQVARHATTTATDIYQLGALAYEVLSGVRPFDSDLAQPELERRIREVDPAPMSEAARAAEPDPTRALDPSAARTWAALLEGDLDVIVARALAKEPERRYGSMEALADDLTRHLEGRPIMARPATVSYRLGRLLRRQRWIVPAAAALIALVAFTTVQQVAHTRELTTERNRAEAVTAFMAGVLNSTNPWDGGQATDVTLEEVLDGAVLRADVELAAQPDVLAQVLEVIAASHHVSERYGTASDLRARVLALQTDLWGPESQESREARIRLARSVGYAAGPDSAHVVLRPVLRPESSARAWGNASRPAALHALGGAHWYASDLDSALVLFDSADAGFAALDVPAEERHARMLSDYSRLWREAGRAPEPAVEMAKRAVAMLSSVLPEGHLDMAEARVNLAGALTTAGQPADALVEMNRVVPVFEERLAADHPSTLALLNNRALMLAGLERLPEAEAQFRELLHRTRESRRSTPKNRADLLQNLAVILKDQEKIDEALTVALQAHGAYREALGDHYLAAFPLLTMAEMELARSRPRAGLERASAAHALLSRTLPDGHYATAVARCRMGRAQRALGDDAAGRTSLQEANRMLRESSLPEDHPYRRECREALTGDVAR